MNQLFYRKLALFTALLCFSTYVVAQTTISGSIKDAETKEALPGASIKLDGTTFGTITDVDGNFSLNVKATPPFTLKFSYVGYLEITMEVTGSTDNIEIELVPNTLLEEILISDDPLQHPLSDGHTSIEIMEAKDIRETGAPDPYAALRNVKGVDVVTQSLTFQSVNVRGFGRPAPTRPAR